MIGLIIGIAALCLVAYALYLWSKDTVLPALAKAFKPLTKEPVEHAVTITSEGELRTEELPLEIPEWIKLELPSEQELIYAAEMGTPRILHYYKTPEDEAEALQAQRDYAAGRITMEEYYKRVPPTTKYVI